MAKVFSPTERWSVCLAVIDFLRMFVLHPDGAALLLKTIETGNGGVSANALSANPHSVTSELSCKLKLFSCLHLPSLFITGTDCFRHGNQTLLFGTEWSFAPYVVSDVLMETFRKAVAPPLQPANLLTILKAVTNLFDSSCLHQWLRIHCAEVSPQVK